jgi:hypothetical protein
MILLHTLLWQLAWLAAVLGAANGPGWLGPLAAVPVVGGALAAGRCGWGTLATAAVLGAVVDSLLGHADLVRMADGAGGWAAWPPPWMTALWLMLASALGMGLAWLNPGPLAAVLGAAAAVAAYAGGERLGALAFPSGAPPALAAVACAYAVVLPLLLWRRDACRRCVGADHG